MQAGGADGRQDPVTDAETEELPSLIEKHPTVTLMLLVRTLRRRFLPSEHKEQLNDRRKKQKTLARRSEALVHVRLIGNSELASWQM